MSAKIIIVFVLLLDTVFGSRELSDWTVLYDYTDFASTSPFLQIVPELSTESTWGFQVDNRHRQDCEHKNVTIVLQHGSLPLINPLDEQFPEYFYIERSPSSRAIFSILSNNVTLESTLKTPKPGPWYSVAYLPRADGQIIPSDLFVNCRYRIRNWFSAKTLINIKTINVNEKTRLQLPSIGKSLFKFFVPFQVHELLVNIKGCSYGNQSGCALTLSSRGQGLPGPKATTVTQICSANETNCTIKLFHPEVNTWNYLEVQSTINEELKAALSFELKECTVLDKYLPDSSCQLSPLLDRFTYSTKFKDKFAFVNGTSFKDIVVHVAENQSMGIPFQLRDGQDTGGSLVVKLHLQKLTGLHADNVNVKVDVCLQRDVVPVNVDILFCDNGYHGHINNTPSQGQTSLKVIVPYPQTGLWVLGLMLQCYTPPKDNKSEAEFVACGALSAALNASISTDACVEGGCGSHGECINYLNGQVLYTTCRCNPGWRGYGCTDGTEVKEHSEQLIELLLLTISNIVFLPAIVLALYRRHYVEALVYTYNMAFSTMYHMCDGGRMDGFSYCTLRISVLSVCDFVGSSTSIWVTLVAMSRPPLQLEGLLQVAGPLGLLVGVLYRKTSAYLFLIPAGLGLLLIFISWMCRCCYRHKCYPSKKRYVLCLLPGMLLVGGALAIFTFFQNTDNYMYTHSCWHVCIALSIVFLLPPRETRGLYKVKDKFGLTVGSTYQSIRSNNENHVI